MMKKESILRRTVLSAALIGVRSQLKAVAEPVRLMITSMIES